MTAVHHSGHGTKPGSVSPLERVRRVLGGGGHSRDSSSDGGGADTHHHNPLFSMSHHASHSLSRHVKFGLGGSSQGAGRGLPHSSYSCPADLLSHGGAHLHHQGRGNASHLGPLFGRSLSTYQGMVPPVLRVLCDFLEEHGLETEGLFRVSASQKSVNRLKASLDAELMSVMTSSSTAGASAGASAAAGQASSSTAAGASAISSATMSTAVANWQPPEELLEAPRDVPAAAAIVKLFLRELPQALIPKEMTQQFVDALGDDAGLLGSEDKETSISDEVVERLRALVVALPPPNFVALKFLAEFLSKVAAKSDKNFMSSKSLGMVFAPCLFSLDAMEMMAITCGAVGHPGSHHPHPGGSTSTVTAPMGAAEMIDLPLAKKLCAQTQEVVVALIGGCGRIFAPVEDRSGLDTGDEDCEQLFLKCRPPLAAKRCVATSPDDINESESLSQFVESVDEVTVIEVDPPESKPNPLTSTSTTVTLIEEEEEEENVSLVIMDEPTTSASAAAVALVGMDDIDKKRARERTEEMPAFYASRPTLAQLRKGSSGSGSGSDGGYRQHRRHRHRQRHHSSHSSPSKRAKRQYGAPGGISSSASSEDNSSCSNLNQNDQENREPNVACQLNTDDADDTKGESIGMLTTDDENSTGAVTITEVAIESIDPEGAGNETSGAPVKENEEENNKERRSWLGAMDLNDLPVVAQRSIQGHDEVMFSPRASIIIPREEAIMMERAAGNTTTDHEVRRGDVPAGLGGSGGYGRRRRTLAYGEEDDDEDDYDEVEACAASGAAFRQHRRMMAADEQVVPTGEKTQAEVILGTRHQQRTARRVSPRRKNDPAYQAASVLRRRASKLKKRLAAEEEIYTNDHNGMKPTKADRMIHPEMRNLVVQLRQCKAELKRLVEDPSPATAALILAANGVTTKTDFPKPPGIGSPNTADLETMVADIEDHLKCIRDAASRPDKLEEMSPAEVTAEKLSLQRALVYLENKFGRPNNPEEKKVVWNLYDRYRNVKRAIVRHGMTKPNTNLIPIPEHVQIDFPKSDHTIRGGGDSKNGKRTPELQRGGNGGSQQPDSETRRKDSTQAFATHQVAMRTPSSQMVGESEFELELASYHEGTVRDLERMQRSLIERRKELKREIRIFEVGFEDNNGRPPRTEEERAPLERTYRSYKEVKARMRLIEALLQKQENSVGGNRNNNGRQIRHPSPTR